MVDVREIQRRLYFDTNSGSAVVMPNFAPAGWYECDVFRVTKAGYFYEYEIKLSVSDFRRDREKHTYDWRAGTCTSKHMALRYGAERGPSRFYFVMPDDIADKVRSEIPEWAGLFECRGGSGWPRCTKQAPVLHKRKVSPAIIRQAQSSALGRFWELHTRWPDVDRIQRLKAAQEN